MMWTEESGNKFVKEKEAIHHTLTPTIREYHNSVSTYSNDDKKIVLQALTEYFLLMAVNYMNINGIDKDVYLKLAGNMWDKHANRPSN